MAPKVSIIILNWNSKEDTLECLESVYQIDYPNYEVIVVDNGSTDGSVEAIKAIYPQTIIIENEMNLGFAEGNNKGITYAMGEESQYIMLLNNDTIIAPEAIKLLVEIAKRDKRIGALGPLILYYGTTNRVWSAGGIINLNKGDWVRICYGRINENIYDVDALSGCALMLRAATIMESGLLDSNFFLYGEDIDLCLRIKKCGYSVICMPKAKVWHKVGKTIGGSDSPEYIYYTTRNRLLFMRKHGSCLSWLSFSPYFVYSVLIRRNLRFIFEKRPDNVRAVVRGTRDFFLRRFGKGLR